MSNAKKITLFSDFKYQYYREIFQIVKTLGFFKKNSSFLAYLSEWAKTKTANPGLNLIML